MHPKVCASCFLPASLAGPSAFTANSKQLSSRHCDFLAMKVQIENTPQAGQITDSLSSQSMNAEDDFYDANT
eukprot:6214578-Pleurochrysis_carterae.AAC.3